jgi:hypothetical protein
LWAPRVKTTSMFSRGKIIELSQLENSELNSLVALVG